MMLVLALEWLAFGGSMLCSIWYGNGGYKGPILGVIVALLFMAFGLTAGVYAAAVSNIFFLGIHIRNLRLVMTNDIERTNKRTKTDIQRLVDLCHGAAVAAGWWTDLETGERKKTDVPLRLCLIHSEISEAMEADRKDMMDDKLPHRKGLEVELADAVIRICDLAGSLDLDLGGAIAEKMAFNAVRPDHKVENRKLGGGKKY